MFKVVVTMDTKLETEDFVAAFIRFYNEFNAAAKAGCTESLLVPGSWIEYSSEKHRALLSVQDLAPIGHELQFLNSEGDLVENPPEISAETVGKIAIDKMPAKIAVHIREIFQSMGLV